MTEMTKGTGTAIELRPVVQRFILHWGEMGSRWGINRTVAQVHALLYVSDRPLTAEEIAQTLEVARSNVSTSLKELQAWGIVHLVHVLGDRRDHFETMTDVWQMFQIVLTERKRREIDPTLALLRECVAEADKSPGDAHTRARLRELLTFFETITDWYEQVRGLPTRTMVKFIKMGGKVRHLLGLAS
jgi:DNA-binding transcriptional regulator GbsR (MarR family)